MRYADTLASELSLISKSDLTNRRGHAVARLVREFERQSPALNDEGVELYDVALRFLIADLEAAALAALSERLADIPNAPPASIRVLAFHDDIAVAGPVLERSPRLEPGDLIAVVGEKGQEHIVLVARRADLTEAVTDKIVARGASPALQTLAANGRAPLSTSGRDILVRRSGADHRLAAELADRFGLPARLRERLIEDAQTVLNAHLAAVAPRAPTTAMGEAVAASVQAAHERAAADLAIDATGALVQVRHEPPNGDYSHESAYLDLLRTRQLREALQIVADRARMSHDMVLTVFANNDLDMMLTVLRAADMSWPAAEETLTTRATGLDRWALREMMRNKFHMMSMRDAGMRARIVRAPMAGAADG